MTAVALKVLNTGQFPDCFNHTFITLIPKKNALANVVDFYSISLCNVTYKLISKVLANRLKVLLPKIISESQSAFIPGHQITNNILVVYELVHYLRRKSKVKKGYMSLKLKMSKAYNRVTWSYLESVMFSLGFRPKIVSLILACVSSATFPILINGTLKDRTTPNRGLR